jgi:hypothetical protein
LRYDNLSFLPIRVSALYELATCPEALQNEIIQRARIGFEITLDVIRRRRYAINMGYAGPPSAPTERPVISSEPPAPSNRRKLELHYKQRPVKQRPAWAGVVHSYTKDLSHLKHPDYPRERVLQEAKDAWERLAAYEWDTVVVGEKTAEAAEVREAMYTVYKYIVQELGKVGIWEPEILRHLRAGGYYEPADCGGPKPVMRSHADKLLADEDAAVNAEEPADDEPAPDGDTDDTDNARRILANLAPETETIN